MNHVLFSIGSNSCSSNLHGGVMIMIKKLVAVSPTRSRRLLQSSSRRVFTTSTTSETTTTDIHTNRRSTRSSSPQQQQQLQLQQQQQKHDDKHADSSSILRFDVMTGTWVVYSKNRRNRPNQMNMNMNTNTNSTNHIETANDDAAKSSSSQPQRIRLAQLPRIVHDCPFCKGNEHLTPTPTSLSTLSSGGMRMRMRMRVVPNKYPAVAPLRVDHEPHQAHHHRNQSNNRNMPLPFLTKNDNDHILLNNQVDAVGFHEVVIESDYHNEHLATSTSGSEMTRDLLATFLQRGLEHRSQSPAIEHTVFFKNHGKTAGASLIHPHSQIVSTRKLESLFFLLWWLMHFY
jgi:galactose-1-phosphate uridylyltransferase